MESASGTLTGGEQPEPSEDSIQIELSPSFQAALDHTDIATAINFVRDGGFLQKYPRPTLCRHPHSRVFQVDLDNLTLRWLSPKKNVKRTLIQLATVTAFVSGVKSDFFSKRPDEVNLAFELVCPRFRLRLVCPNLAEYKLWSKGLIYALSRAEAKRRRGVLFHTQDFFRRMWDIADADLSGALSFSELCEACGRLDIPVDLRYLKYLHYSAVTDMDAAAVIDYLEFRKVMERLMVSARLAAHFASYRDPQRDLIKVDGFKNFLLDVQGEGESTAEREVAVMRELKWIFAEPGGTTLAGFCRIMRSEWNSIIDPELTIHDQDLSHPVTSFWIYSVSDPFDLPQPDLRDSKSLLGSLQLALLRGVRYLTAKVFIDPLNPKAIVVGRTRRRGSEIGYRDCPFEAFLRCIESNAFRTTPYPLILHLEFLCSPHEKGLAGQAIKDTLGNSLFLGLPNGAVPTVESVMKKVIISTPLLQTFDPALNELSGYEPDNRLVRLMAELTLREVNQASLHMLKIPPQIIPNENLPRLNPIQRESIGWLSQVTGLPMRALRLQDSERQKFSAYALNTDQMTALDGAHLAQINQTTMAYCYPAGDTQAQTNRAFAYALARGFQCVALNRSVGGMSVIMQEALFDLNGRCGYVCKPDDLHPKQSHTPKTLDIESEDTNKPAELRISVLEGFQIPRGHVPLEIRRDGLCPLVSVSVRGLPEDCKTISTRAIINNGLDPIWGEQTMFFTISNPSVAFVTFEVRNYEDPGSSTFLAGAAALLTTIRPGIRWVTLRDRAGRPIRWAGLLVKVQLRMYTKERRGVKSHRSAPPSVKATAKRPPSSVRRPALSGQGMLGGGSQTSL